VRPLAHARFAADLRPSDSVRRRRGLKHRLRTGPEQLVLELPDRTIAFPTGVSAALDAVLGGDAVTVGALPGLDEPGQLVLVRRLLREGVVVPAGTGAGQGHPTATGTMPSR
jgi:hypothetical protein